MGLYFNKGVELRNLQPQSVIALQVAAEVYAEEGQHCVVTSAYRVGSWMQTLLHGKGLAVDLSVRDLDGVMLSADVIDRIVKKLTVRIGKADGGQFDVVPELQAGASAGWSGPHIHLEFDPKNPLPPQVST
jgi:hypothetical protein